ncbi:MAG: AsnC family transcriptional regulator [Conexivisphaerales archaeon]
MGKNSMLPQLDDVDTRIIALLSRDSRMHYKDIAKNVGVSIPTVKERVCRLVELGVIKKFTIIVDQEKLWGRVKAVIFSQSTLNDVEKMKEKMNENEQIRAAYFVTGDKQVMIYVEVDSLKGISELITKHLQEDLGLSNPTSVMITQTLKEDYEVKLRANSALEIRCDFCKTIIYGKPLIEYIDGVRYYFSAKECAEAYKARLNNGKRK